MGWDAYSSAKYHYGKHKFQNKEIGLSFKKASEEILEKASYYDAGFPTGGLDCPHTRDMLQKATSESFYHDLSVQDVQELEENWDFEYTEEEAWAYWSARKFIEVCKKHNLSISFSY